MSDDATTDINNASSWWLWSSLQTVWTTLSLTIAAIVLGWLVLYRRSIRRHVSQLEQDLSQPLLKRVTNNDQRRRGIPVLELNPKFVQTWRAKGWKLTSLGEYLSSLRPVFDSSNDNDKDDTDKNDNSSSSSTLIRRELETWMGATLLRALGPQVGKAALPLLGFSSVSSTTSRIATQVASWLTARWIVSSQSDQKEEEDDADNADKGVLPLSLYELSALANLNQTIRGGDSSTSNNMDQTPLELLQQGEVGYTPRFGDSPDGSVPVPNPFLIDDHWETMISDMEDAIQKQNDNDTYDPNDKSFPEPTPIHPRLLPDLYLGWGHAKCTHSKREIIRNRLLCILLNKLSYNVYRTEQEHKHDDEDKEKEKNNKKADDTNDDQDDDTTTPLFVVQFSKDDPKITSAVDFVHALMAHGHKVEVCPRSTLTTFGVAACVKETDGTWSNVPLGYFVRTGYESTKTKNRAACVAVPHGGVDLQLQGPLVGTDFDTGESYRCNIQIYMAIEGLCGWHSNHNADVPWIRPVNASTNPYDALQTEQAVRLASLLAVTFNAIGTEQHLPFGGYGLLGVCNDTAALLDQALQGTTHLYPLVSSGRFLFHIAHRLQELQTRLDRTLEHDNYSDMHHYHQDTVQLIHATKSLASDLHAAPGSLASSCERFLATCAPEMNVFALGQESQEIMEHLQQQFRDETMEQKESSSGSSETKPQSPGRQSRKRGGSGILSGVFTASVTAD